ncbi:AMP-binding protein [Sphingorhabdus sp. Alg239-R122]|uniref:AMP-binding protein n=1 Tax=Sphingorhabdus sp. Alg239-R122 TaxID=2305989 RepID=UPI0013DA6A76|nr:AMP-binding protein [Sphingorhabdus sp. Alg239-R122]
MTDSPIWNTHYNHPCTWDQSFDPMSLPDMFFDSARRLNGMPLLDFMGRKYSYTSVAATAEQVAKGLQDMGIERGTRVGLFLPNVPQYVAAYYGAMAAGATIVNFSPLYTPDELAHQVEDSGTTILITLSAKALLPRALEVLENSSLERVIVGTVAEALPMGKSILYRLFKRGEEAAIPTDSRVSLFAELIDNDGDYDAVDIDPVNDPAVLQYTGGTTGTPKGAILTHQNLTANARQVNAIDPHHETDEDRILGVLPFFHVFANTCVLNRTVMNGGEIVMLPRFDAVQALKAINRTKVTALPGVPTMYQALLDCPEIDKTDFSSLRVCISGGAPLSGELKTKFEERTDARLVEGYGLTESSGVVSVNPYEGLSKTGTIGHPLPGTEVRFVDKEDPSKQVAKGEPGELIFSGPQVMKGYWNRPDADEDVFLGKFLRTGDVAVIDEEGYVKIVDRIKDMISVGGFKVFPSQIEEVADHHEQVKEVLVIGVPDEYRGEMPKAFVTLEDGADIDGSALKDWLNAKLGKHERVTGVVVREELPKTMIGKLDRKALRAEENVT